MSVFLPGQESPVLFNVALPARLQRPIRFTRDQRDRLQKAARRRGQTVQTFMAVAVMEAVADAEAEDTSQFEKPRNEPGRVPQQGGLFTQRPTAAQSPSPQTAHPFVVQVTSGAGDIRLAGRLAKKIADAPAHDRDRLKADAVSALRLVAASEAERVALVQDLEAELVRQLPQPGGLQLLRDAVRHLV